MTNLNTIPTVTLAETVRVVTPTGAYDAQVLLTFANGERNIAFTENGTIRIIRVGAKAKIVHSSN